MSPRAAGLLAALALVLTAPVALAAPPTWQSRVASAARYADTRNMTLTLSEEVSASIVVDGSALPLTLGRVGQVARVTFSATAGQRLTADDLVTRQTEFDIFLKDTDNVTSKRTIQIVVEDDRPPEVDVVVDVIRKVGSVYMCTPQALIPFTKESKIRDDKGLNRVDYVFSYYEVEPMAVTVKRAEFASWYFNNPPGIPSLGNLAYRLAVHGETEPAIFLRAAFTPSRGLGDRFDHASETVARDRMFLERRAVVA